MLGEARTLRDTDDPGPLGLQDGLREAPSVCKNKGPNLSLPTQSLAFAASCLTPTASTPKAPSRGMASLASEGQRWSEAEMARSQAAVDRLNLDNERSLAELDRVLMQSHSVRSKILTKTVRRR